MKRFCLLVLASLAAFTEAQDLRTRWAAGVTPQNVHREYPRPTMVRKNWVNLNGLWTIQVTYGDPTGRMAIVNPHPARHILVPFPIESQLSGARDLLLNRVYEPKQPDTLVYSRTFERPKGEGILLHFGAVDWQTTVLVNGVVVGKHEGGYDPFTFDITSSLTSSGPQTLQVLVTDPSDRSFQPRGKQVVRPGGIFYTPTSGIWQTVWLESVPGTFLSRLLVEPNRKTGEVAVTVSADQSGANYAKEWRCRMEALENGKVIATTEAPFLHGDNVPESPGRDPNPTTFKLKIKNPKEWSPESPKLYDLRVSLVAGRGKPASDQVTSYFAFRDVGLVKDSTGQPVFALNGKPYFMVGPLDQGFWPDGLYTAPSDAAMKYDLDVTKRLGFNMIRKHVKVEPERWYYWCDKMGILVFQDMPSGDKYIGPSDPDITRTRESSQVFRKELQAMIDARRNHPCIVSWVLYNEGWGQWNTAEMAAWLKQYDPSRLLDSVSGWADRGVGDMHDIHVYPDPAVPSRDPNRALFLGEFGGLGLPVPGHMWQEKGWGYQSFKTSAELTDKFVEQFTNMRFLQARGLSGAVYTQTTDVETELNGLMTYDREVMKMDEARVRKAILALFLPPPTLEQIVPTAEVSSQEWKFTFAASGDWMQPNFGESAWQRGPGGFGTPETPGSIVNTRWDSKDIYLRRRFVLLRDFKPGELFLRLSYDDDVKVYLDGKLLYQAPGWTTSYKFVPIPASFALTKGEHVLAIHCHQNTGGQFVDAGLVRISGL